MGLAGSGVLGILWLATAFSLPLFSVEFLRFDNEAVRIHIAVPMLLIGIISLCAVFSGRSNVLTPDIRRNRRKALGLGFGFLVWHVIALFPAQDMVIGVREVVKLSLGLLAFWAVTASFPLTPRFMRLFWSVVIFSSCILMGFLMHRYYFVFHARFLSNDIMQETRSGRNQLTAYLVYVFPFAIIRLMMNWKKPNVLPEPLLLGVALIYGSSRGAWISTFFGLAALLYLVAKFKGLGRSVGYTVWAALIGVAALSILTMSGRDLEATKRFLWFFDPSAAPELNTYYERGWRFWSGINMFLSSPIMGVGLGNSLIMAGSLTHNDYSQILGETGFVGFALFVGILRTVWKSLMGPRMASMKGSDWTSLSARMALPAVLFSLCFNNTYTTPFLWIFLGLCLAQADIDAKAAVGRPDCPPSKAPAPPRRLSGVA